MSVVSPVFVELRANINEFSSKMGEAQREINRLEKKGASSFQKMAAVGKAAFFSIGAAAVGIGVIGVKQAMELEVANARLEASLGGVGTSMAKLKDPIEAVSEKMRKYGFDNDATAEALANMVVATKGTSFGFKEMGTAADLAAFKHISLAEAATVVARAHGGNLRALKALGIDLPIAASGAIKLEAAHKKLSTATKTASDYLRSHAGAANSGSRYFVAYTKLQGKIRDAQKGVNDQAKAGDLIMKALHERLGGQASAASQTFAGKLKVMKVDINNLAEKIGMWLIPKLEDLIAKIGKTVDWMKKHQTAAKILGGILAGVVFAALAAYIIQLAIATAATITLAVTTTASAIAVAAAWVVASGGTILLIAGIVAAITFAAMHWKEMWSMMKTTFNAVWSFIKENWQLIAIILTGPIGLAVVAIVKHWQTIKAGFVAVWDGIRTAFTTAWDSLVKAWDSAWAMLKNPKISWTAIWDGMKNGFATAFNAVKAIFTSIFDSIGMSIKGRINGWIGLINGLIALINKIPTVTIMGKTIGIPKIPPIPMLAEGGVVNRATLAMIGEAGPEAVIPLSKMGSMGGGQTVNIHVAGSVVTQSDLVTSVRNELAQLLRRKGLSTTALGV